MKYFSIVLTFLCVGVLFLFGSIILQKKSKRNQSLVLFSLSVCSSVILLWLGMDFSPSFTLIFLFAGVLLLCVSELIFLCFLQKKSVLVSVISVFLFCIGLAFTIPSVLIYAAGDDWYHECIYIALGLSLLLNLLLFVYRRKTNLKGADILENTLHFFVASLTFFSAFHSTALFPYAIGLFLCLIGRRLTNGPYRTILVWLGLSCLGLFSVAPMLF